MRLKILILTVILFAGSYCFGQSFAINTDGSTANPSALLDVKSINKGLLIPRMTNANRNAIASPAKGLLVFIDDVDSTGFHYYDGAVWRWLEALSSTNAAWKTTGNAGTDTAVNFIGTTDNMPLRFKQNNANIGNWNVNNGNYFIGRNAGIAITTGIDNSYFGTLSNSTVNNINNSTAIGAKSQVDTSNAMVLGSISGINTATANTNVAIGTTKPKAALHISRGSSGSTATIPASRTLLIEDNASSYIQFLNPVASESGILAGNDGVLIKSGVIFNADSSISMRTGGNNTRVYVSKTGFTGINNTLPQARLHVSSSLLTNAQYLNIATSIFENGTPGSNAFLQLMNPSNRNFSIASSTDVSILRSSLSFQADSSLSFETGGFVSRMRLDKAGVLNVNNRIGINNSTPQARLHVNSIALAGAQYISTATGIFENGTTGSNAFLQLMNPASRSFTIASGTDASFLRSSISFQPDSAISFETGGFVSRMELDKTGVLYVNNSIGINKTAPQARLHVSSSALANAQYINSAIGIFESGSTVTNGFLQLMCPSSRTFRIVSGTDNNSLRSSISFNPDSSISFQSGGLLTRMQLSKFGVLSVAYRIGINNTLPTADLDVDGTFKLGVSGTINQAIIKTSVSVNATTVPANSFLDVDIAVVNAAAGGSVSISPQDDLPAGIIIASVRVSAAGNVVRMRLWNQTGLPIDPPQITFNIGIIQ